jgi:hypothetical protein
LTPTNEGSYTVGITNAAGSTHVSFGPFVIALPGMVEAWGSDDYGECNRPAALTNVTAIACGWQFNVALLANGAVTSWGDDYFGQTAVPAGLSNVVAIAAGAQHTLALLSNGTVQAWGDGFDGDTNIPAGLTNVVAIAAGEAHNLALKSDGKVVAWGYNDFGQTNVPAGLSNVMAVAAGDFHSVALKNDGTVVAWGDNSSGQTNVPGELPTSVITTSGGLTPTLYTNNYPPIAVKLIAAGGDHTITAIFSSWVQYPVDVSKDLLLIYNTNSLDSSNVCQYYQAHRPMVASCTNVLGVGVTTDAIMDPTDFTNVFQPQVIAWLTNNPTKRPLYVILFQDIPEELSPYTSIQTCCGSASVQYQLRYWTAPGWEPFVSSINMNNLADAGESTNFNSSDGTNDCIAYIDKLASIGSNYSTGQLILSASEVGYGNANWYFDDIVPGGVANFFSPAVAAVTNISTTASVTYTNGPFEAPAEHITNASNVAGFGSWGVHGYFLNNQGQWTNAGYATNGYIRFTGQSGWYIIETAESFNGQRGTSQGSFLDWYASNAFGGTNYSNTPVGAVSHVEEPGLGGLNSPSVFFGDWAAGRIFSHCAWNSANTPYLQVIGDPFTKQ